MSFRGLLKLVAAAVGAAVIGIGLGLGVSKVNGDGGRTPPPQFTGSPVRSPSPGTPAATTASASPRSQTTTETTAGSQTSSPLQGSVTPSVQVLSAVLFPAATASGRARQRARISVRVRVTNRDTQALTPPNALLRSGSDRIGIDAAAENAAGALLEPIAPSASATGELRFEVAGAVTRRLDAKPRARLAIVNRIVALKITISPTPAPPG